MIKLVEKFERYLIEDGKSLKTIESYVGGAVAFVAFLESKLVDFNGETLNVGWDSKQTAFYYKYVRKVE